MKSGEHEFVYQFSVGCFVNGGGVEGTDWPNIGACQKLREIDQCAPAVFWKSTIMKSWT